MKHLDYKHQQKYTKNDNKKEAGCGMMRRQVLPGSIEKQARKSLVGS
jgi:hypothetical protein